MKRIQRIAVFHCTARVGSAWACAEGICLTLEKMGYQVIDCGRPEHMRVTLEQLAEMDMIILSAAEWYTDELKQRFGAAWASLKAVKIAWFAESAHRDDRDFTFAETRAMADFCYYPAAQDADEFSGIWLPFGADTEVFKPKPVDRDIDVGFLGAMYPKRVEYVKRINYPITYINSVSDPDYLKSFGLLADAYSSVRIFVNFPALSRLLVTKVTEVMACKAMLITPRPDHASAQRNLEQFEDGKHLVYYDPEHPESLKTLISHYQNHPEEVERIAEAGYQKIRMEDSLKARLQKVIGDVEFSLTYPQTNKPVTQAPARDTESLPLILTSQGKFFISNRQETIQSELWHFGRFEPLGAQLAIAVQPLLPGAVLDIGANIGIFTVPVALALRDCTVLSFEPQRMVFMQLCANVLANQLTNVFPRNLAVGLTDGQKPSILVPFFNVYSEKYTGSVSLDPQVHAIRRFMTDVAEPDQWAVHHDEIPLISLDSTLGGQQTSFIKVDVEGMEIQVLTRQC